MAMVRPLHLLCLGHCAYLYSRRRHIQKFQSALDAQRWGNMKKTYNPRGWSVPPGTRAIPQAPHSNPVAARGRRLCRPSQLQALLAHCSAARAFLYDLLTMCFATGLSKCGIAAAGEELPLGRPVFIASHSQVTARGPCMQVSW